MGSAVKAAIADGVLTFTWMMCASTLGLCHYLIAASLGIQGMPLAALAIDAVLLFLMVFVFNVAGVALGGASFNPTGNVATYAAGLGDDTVISMAFRFPAQAVGAAAGAAVLLRAVPESVRHLVVGPSLKVDPHTGAVAEGILTFGITFCVLLITLRGPPSAVVQAFLTALVIMGFVVVGSAYTGPSMNPVNAFGWAYIYNSHTTWEQFYVYWVCPLAGAVLAAWLFRFIFPPPTKQKESIKKKKKKA